MKLASNVFWPPKMRLPLPVTSQVLEIDENEDAMSLFEGYAQNKAGSGDVRIQAIIVPNRSHDSLAAWFFNLGPVDDFMMDVAGAQKPAPPYHQLALMEHTVAELRHYADRDRFDDFAHKLLEADLEELRETLVPRYVRVLEEDQALVRNRSTFSRLGHHQRDGYQKPVRRNDL